MILRNHTKMRPEGPHKWSFLKIKRSPSGEILVHILTMTFLAARETYYAMNSKHAWLIGTV